MGAPRSIDRSDRRAREALSERFFTGTSHSYDRVVAVTTFGLDACWKRRLLAHVPADARSILDLACGTGIVTQRLVEKAPKARIVGVDLTEEYLEVARARFASVDRDVTFLHANAETMEPPGSFDVVVSSYLPKYIDAEILLDRLEGRLEPGGTLAVHDFGRPRGRIPRAVWQAHMALLRVVGTRLFPDWHESFDRDLERLIATSRWDRTFRNALVRRGYRDVLRERLSFGAAVIVSGRKTA